MAGLQFQVEPGGAICGVLSVPGDKSISHRAIMFGALAEGVTQLSGFLEGEDCLATMNAFRDMGVRIDGPENGSVTVHGVGRDGLRKPQGPLDMGNSGTAMRLMAGLLAGQPFDSRLTGDASLSLRPMRRVTDPLQAMGARLQTATGGTPPLSLSGPVELRGIDYTMPVASAQVKSCLLLAGVYARGRTCVTEPAPTRDHTERMMEAFGYPIERSEGRVCLAGGGVFSATRVDVPSDISSAAFFLVGASIARGSDLTLRHVGINPTRTGVIDVLRAMGADIEVLDPRTVGGEPVAELRVRPARLRGIDVPTDLVPLAIDEFPAIFVAAACAEGRTRVNGAAELRVKETDRIQVMADGLAAIGVSATPTPDGIVIDGGEISGGEVDSRGDHRIAMAFAMAGLRASAPVQIRDCRNVNTSFPGFAALAGSAGLGIRELRNGD